MSSRPSLDAVTADSNLSWLTSMLWRVDHEDGDAIEAVTASRRRPRGRVVEAYAVLPHLRRPRMLIPIDSRSLASASLRQFNDAQRLPTRTARVGIGTAMSLGVGQQVFRDRLFFTTTDAPGRAELSSRSLVRHLAEVLGRDDARAAIAFRRSTPNRKPILRVSGLDGSAVAFVKVGWNELTRSLVANEGRVLQRMAETVPTAYRVPRVLHAGPWHDLETVAISQLPNRFWRFGAPSAVPIAATREIALASGVERAVLATSRYAATLSGRFEALVSEHADSVRIARDMLAHVLHRVGPCTFDYGSWHGDWAPWNMAKVGDNLYVWDWERSGGPVPLGFDAIHFTFQSAMRDCKHDAVAALGRSRQQLPSTWDALHLDEATRAAAVCLYLADMVARYAEAAQLGAPVSARLLTGTVSMLGLSVRDLG